jgi:hypothetical protein
LIHAFSRKTLVAFGALAFAAAGLAQGAHAASGVNVGMLSCTIAPGIGLVLGSSKGIDCSYEPNEGPKQRYEGSITKLGVDIGFTGKSYVKWLVFAPGKLGSGALAGHYAGATAEATIAAGLGANVLVGGSDKSVALQPLSVQGQTGLNVAVGIAGLKLKYQQ